MEPSFQHLLRGRVVRRRMTASSTTGPLRRNVAGDLLDLQNDELRGLQRCEADQDVHDTEVDVRLGRGLAVALHEVSLLRRAALEGTLAEQALHECADI